jgi:hypothetical protein
MARDRATRHWWRFAGIALVFVVLLIGVGVPAFAGAQQVGGIAVGVATPESAPEETVEPSPVVEDTPGGVEAEGPETATPTATPGEGTGGEALAPGTVTVVVWTSDRGVLPERAMVCIADVCQSISGSRSGVDLWFDRVEEGRHQIVVRVGAPYGTTTTDVQVRPGSNSRVELTLVVTQPIPGEKLDPTPPPVSAEGPLRAPLQRGESTTAQGDDALKSTGLTVSALPATGAAPASPLVDAVVPPLLAIAAVLLGAAVILGGVRRTD